MSGIHHFVPVLHRGDAVGRHTLRLRDATRARGIRSEIYVDTVDPETVAETEPVLSYAGTAQKGDVVVYQFATASAMAPWLAGRSETLVVNYHNITPPDLMAPWDNHLALGQLQAQGDLRLLAPRATLAVADSAYNEAHLARSGFAATAVIPPSAALDPDRHRRHRARTEPADPGGRAVAGRRPGVAQQGAREHGCCARRRPCPRRPRGDAAGHRQARHGLLRRRPAPLRRRDGAGARRQLRRPRERRHGGVGLCRRRRARRDLRARGLLRAGGGGDDRRAPRGRLRPGGAA